MDSLKGATLIKADGSKVAAEEGLAGKDLVLYYFSAHWCPPCRNFTPLLKDFYDEAEGIEIVFVSSDRSPDDMVNLLHSLGVLYFQTTMPHYRNKIYHCQMQLIESTT